MTNSQLDLAIVSISEATPMKIHWNRLADSETSTSKAGNQRLAGQFDCRVAVKAFFKITKAGVLMVNFLTIDGEFRSCRASAINMVVAA